MEKRLRSGEGGRRAGLPVFARVYGWNKRRVNGPCNISRKRRGHGKGSRRGSRIDGVREVTEEAALMIGVMGLAGRRLLPAGRAAGLDRTHRRRGESTGLHGKASRCENLHQESQQKYWKGRFRRRNQSSGGLGFLPPVAICGVAATGGGFAA